MKKVTPCPLCCRVFLNAESACKHVILCHENYNTVETEKEKFTTLLKSTINARVTRLSQRLVNQLSKRTIRERAEEIVKRQEPQNSGLKTCEILSKLESDPNYQVSKFCDVCRASN